MPGKHLAPRSINKTVYTDFLYRNIALSLGCTNPVEKDPICQIQLEKLLILSATNVIYDINRFSCRHFWLKSLKAK